MGCVKIQNMGYTPPVQPPPTTQQIAHIPNYLFQSWKTTKLDKLFCQHIRRWTRTNPDFHYFLFDDQAASNFIRFEFGPVFASAFDCVKVGAARCDIWRLLIIYRFGGFYFDFDVGPRKRNPFRTWGIAHQDLVTGNGMGCAMPKQQRQLYGCPHQWGMVYKPRHPIIKQAIINTLLPLALRTATWTTDISFKPFLSAFWKFRNASNGYMPGWGDQMNNYVFRNRPIMKESMLANDTEPHWMSLNDSDKTVYWEETCLNQMENYQSTVVHNTSTTFCVSWDINTDEWWTQHPEWKSSIENETHHCFQTISDPTKRSILRHLHHIQWNLECTGPSYFAEFTNHGFSRAMTILVRGLHFAINVSRPFNAITQKQWQFASISQNSTTSPCPSMDNYCYWLQLSKCQNRSEMQELSQLQIEEGTLGTQDTVYQTLFQYSIRPQTWLHHELYQFIRKNAPTLVYPFTAIHVRRGDVILHQKQSRKYHTIREYVKAAQQQNVLQPNILLLTDDDNALGEAMQEYPEFNWMAIDRPRFKGKEGGVENYTPSEVPKHDLIAILAELKLIRRAYSFVYSTSRLAELFGGQIVKENATKINIDEGLDNAAIYSKFHVMSQKISNANRSGEEKQALNPKLAKKRRKSRKTNG